MIETQIEKSWQNLLKDEFVKNYWKNLSGFLKSEYNKNTVYPKLEHIFSAFSFTPFKEVKVVILGQDPYHGPKQAHGLSFSVPEGIKIPPSLRNIYKEIKTDIGGKVPESGNLESWAKQGVLLLNSTLTVQSGAAGSHQKKGWEEFTDTVIKKISDKKEGVVFILWGSYAQSKKNLIDNTKHLILESPHPSPLSAHRGFFGCKHFNKTNAYLKSKGKGEIRWL